MVANRRVKNGHTQGTLTSGNVTLGSGSPRRKEILQTLGFSVTILAPEVDETPRAGEAPTTYIERIVSAKLANVRAHVTSDLPIVVADTIVEQEGAILGKPADDDDALRMLKSLSGATHLVRTRFAVAHRDRDAHMETVTTRVVFRALSDDEIRAYVAYGEGRDKAGSYGAQGFASAFVASIDGSFSNVIGLPACEVYVALSRLKVTRGS